MKNIHHTQNEYDKPWLILQKYMFYIATISPFLEM